MIQRHGGDIYHYQKVIDFSTNINPYGPPKNVVETLKKNMDKLNIYPDPDDNALREALGKKLGVEKQQIILGNGAAELIFSVCMAIKPERALLPRPCFLEYERALEAVECKVISYETRKEEGFSLREDFLDAITDKIDILFLSNPNNPTGTMIPQKFFKEILEKCYKTGTYLIVDECFVEFVTGAKNHTLISQLKKYDRLFILKAFTKLYGIPGIRLGYGITGNLHLIGKIKKVTQPWNVSVLAQVAGIAALQEDQFLSDSLKNIEQEKRRMIIALSKAGYLMYESAANYIFFEGEGNLAEECLKNGILIRDCGSYQGLGDGYYRVCIRTRWENDKLLRALLAAKQKAKESRNPEVSSKST